MTVLGRRSLAVAREAKHVISVSSPAFWLKWEENIATPEIPERLMPWDIMYGALAHRLQMAAKSPR